MSERSSRLWVVAGAIFACGSAWASWEFVPVVLRWRTERELQAWIGGNSHLGGLVRTASQSSGRGHRALAEAAAVRAVEEFSKDSKADQEKLLTSLVLVNEGKASALVDYKGALCVLTTLAEARGDLRLLGSLVDVALRSPAAHLADSLSTLAPVVNRIGPDDLKGRFYAGVVRALELVGEGNPEPYVPIRFQWAKFNSKPQASLPLMRRCAESGGVKRFDCYWRVAMRLAEPTKVLDPSSVDRDQLEESARLITELKIPSDQGELKEWTQTPAPVVGLVVDHLPPSRQREVVKYAEGLLHRRLALLKAAVGSGFVRSGEVARGRAFREEARGILKQWPNESDTTSTEVEKILADKSIAPLDEISDLVRLGKIREARNLVPALPQSDRGVGLARILAP